VKENGKIIMAGCTQPGYELISSLLEAGLHISYFVTISAEKAAKMNVSGYADFTPLALKYNIPVYIAEKFSLKGAADISFFQDQHFDLMIQGGWQRLFPEEILKTLRVGAVGVHGSSEFLPKGRGRSPINWSLIEGKSRFIIHYFIIKPGIDDGDIFHFEMFDINEWDDCNTLYYKNVIVSKQVLLKQIPFLLSGNYKVIPQHGEPSYYLKRSADDGLIDWEKSVFEIYDFIRAITKPFPGAFGYIDSRRITIWKAQPFDTRISFPDCMVGEITEVFENGDFVVNCNSGLLLVTDYEWPDGVIERKKIVKDL
jgi:methionyl-tRNA formyltransferase